MKMLFRRQGKTAKMKYRQCVYSVDMIEDYSFALKTISKHILISNSRSCRCRLSILSHIVYTQHTRTGPKQHQTLNWRQALIESVISIT